MVLIQVMLVGAAVLSAGFVGVLRRRHVGFQAPLQRNEALQGFRGFLSLGVFLHHAFIWFHNTHGRGWTDSEGFRQFGESRVTLFFMLAAMLFYGRLLDAREGKIDWLKLYVSRFLRLAPVYWLAMALMFIVLAIATTRHIDGAGTAIVLRSWPDILGSAAAWVGFCMLGMPAIDGYMNTPLITAAVTWTMPYEWTFYLLLPLLALPLRIAMPRTTVALGLAAAVWLAAWNPELWLFVPFLGGMVVAMLIRLPGVATALCHPACAVAAMAAMAAVLVFFSTVYAPLAQVMLGFALAVAASGNDLFGVLRWRAAQALGKWAYSLYLLHGIVLYVTFMLLIGMERAAQLSVLQYLEIVAIVAAVVFLLARASQRWIESPPMRAVPAIVAFLRRRRLAARNSPMRLA